MQKTYPIAGAAFDENAELCMHCEHSTQCAYTNTEQNPATRAFACMASLAWCMQYNLEWQDGELTFAKSEPRRLALMSLGHRALQAAYAAATKEKHTRETKRLLLDTAAELRQLFPKKEAAEITAAEKAKLNYLFGGTAMQAELGAGSAI